MNRTPTKDTAHTMPLLRINHLRAAAFAVATILGATGGAEAGLAEVKADVTYLASDETEGRGTGTKGEALAADYIIKQLEAIGAKPLPALGGWKQEFEFPSGIKPKPEGSSVTITIPGLGEQTLALNEGFYPLAFSDNGTTEGMVVFAGYGITTPESSDGFSYDSYGTLDVKDKVVLVLRYMPEKADADLRQKLARYSALRLKARAAREAGARAVLIVSGPNSDNAGQLIKTGFDSSDAGSSILGASINGAMAEAMFKAAKKDLRETQTAMDDGNPHVAGFPLEGVHAKISIALEKESTKGYNVLAVLPATVPNPLPEYVAIGAHYDHLGRGESGGSLGRSGDAGKIHHGADDNASGTAATIEVGRILAAVSSERQRDTLLCFWSGEEIGLIGSAYFTRNMPLEGRGISCYINMDMVGRSKDDKLTVQGLGSSPDWAKVIEKANVVTNLDLKLEDDPFQPTDSQSLYIAKVPAVELFTGLHLDYHRPSDTADKVNMEGVEKVARFAAAMALDAIRMEKPFEYAVYERRGRGMRGGSGSGTMRVYTGVLPDYTATGDGMRLSGVVPGGPAEKAGLKEGDTIVEFGGAKVTSIYEYMYALDAAKPDKPIKVKVKRGTETIELDLTPKTRE